MILQARIMMNTESAYYGRVMAFTMMAWGVQMVFAGPAGVVADLIGEREVFGIMGLAAFAVAVLGTFGWLAIRNDDHPTLPSTRLAPVPAAASANGANGAATPRCRRPQCSAPSH